MTVCLTQEQKEIIESQGYMVVEFKMFLNKTIDLLKRSFDSFFKAFISFIESKAFCKFVESMQVWAKKVNKIFKESIDIDDLREELFIEEFWRVKHNFVRRIEKKYNYEYKQKTIYYRCRDRC